MNKTNYHFITRLAERFGVYIDKVQYDAILYGAQESDPILIEDEEGEGTWHKVYYKGKYLYVLLRDHPRNGVELATVLDKNQMERKMTTMLGRRVVL